MFKASRMTEVTGVTSLVHVMIKNAPDKSAFIGVGFRADGFCRVSLWSLDFSCSLNFFVAFPPVCEASLDTTAVQLYALFFN